MSERAVALCYVLVVAIAVFALAKPFALQFSSVEDYVRRRNVWLALTIAAFLSPSYWLFLLLAAPLLWWAARKDSNPIALYLLLLLVIPRIDVPIPPILVNEFFDLNHFRVLSLCVLAPLAWRAWSGRRNAPAGGLRALDLLILAFGVLQTALFIRPDLPHHAILEDSLTNMVRRAVLFFVDVYLVYYAISRCCTSRRKLEECMAAFTLACLVLAPLALFESFRYWLLYSSIAPEWGARAWRFAYSELRQGAMRAHVTAGYPIVLGYLLMLALGMWLYLGALVKSRALRYGVFLLLLAGLLVTYSRGPWAAAVVMCVFYVFQGYRNRGRLTQMLAVGALLACVIWLSPIGDRVVKLLPVNDSSHDSTILYRERLATRSWELFQEHPILGDQLAYLKMEDLRQGEGIIDPVNAFAAAAVFTGSVGLLLFVAGPLLVLYKAYFRMRAVRPRDQQFGALGSNLVAAMLGTLVVLGTCSFIGALALMYFVLTGLLAAYLQATPLTASATPAAGHETLQPVPAERLGSQAR